MIKHVVNAKGGLHNRITRSIRLLPFTLLETEAYLKSLSVKLDRYQVLQLYMAFGGVPHYLFNASRGQSTTQVINKACFTATGALRNEFNNLYRSLFDDAANHIKIVKALSKVPKGMTRQEIIEACGFSSGGGTKDDEGAQIDLLIDRADRVINICEMKFYTGEFTIDKRYAAELEQKLRVFREQTKTRKSIFLTLITTYGIKRNEYADRLVDNNLTVDLFFQ